MGALKSGQGIHILRSNSHCKSKQAANADMQQENRRRKKSLAKLNKGENE